MNKSNYTKSIQLVFILIALIAKHTLAADCIDVFPDAAQNSANGGDIDIRWNSRIFNSPDNILDTRNYVYAGPNGSSCDSGNCTISNTVVPSGDFNSFPNNQPNINLGFQATQTISPGNYNNLLLDTEAELRMQPGVYAFRGSFTQNYRSKVIVDSPGTVVIYVRGDVMLNSEAEMNSLGGSRYIFVYTRDDIDIDFNSQINAVLYARDDISLGNNVHVTGAVTARGTIFLESASYITYDQNAVNNTNFDTFCTSSSGPSANLIAEWRLDDFYYTGAADEVTDTSGNGLHGTSVNLDSLPVSSGAIPAIPGNPGTCHYADFNRTDDGYIVIDDPGTGSILDLNEFTVSAWVYARSWPSSELATIASKDENWEFHFNSAGRINWWWGGGNRELTTSASVSINTWHHIAITYESGAQVIYVDGTVAATNNSTDAITLNNDPVYLGTDYAYHSRRFHGLIDEVRIYDGPLGQAEIAAVMAETHACLDAPEISNFLIDVGGGNGSVCAPSEISISARDSGNNIIAGYTGDVDISVSTGHGDWSETGVAEDAYGNFTANGSDTGSADYEFESTGLDRGQIALDLSNTHSETITVTVSDSTAGVSSTSANLVFSENAYVLTENDNLDDDVIAGRRHQFSVEMLKLDPSTGSCGVDTNYNVSDIKAWVARTAADPSGSAPVINNADVSDSVSLPSSEPGSTNIQFPFIAGEANFSLDSSDVGQYSLQLLDDGNYSDVDIAGSISLTVRPFGFLVTVTGNPAAANENGARFTSAGNAFTVNVQAKAWDASDDANDDGVPDFYADATVSNNNDFSGANIASFGQENPAHEIQLSASLLAPVGGVSAGLSPASAALLDSFSSGAASTSTVYFSEVGIIQINAEISGNNYLGIGSTRSNKSNSASISVGRFSPAYFEIDTENFNASCSSGLDYSYMGETHSFDVELMARNAQGDTTSNYQGNYAFLDNSPGRINYAAIDNAVPTILTSRITSSDTLNWTNGTTTLSSDLMLNRNTVPDGSFQQVALGLNVSDTDSISFNTVHLNLDANNDTVDDSIELGEFRLLFGRLRLANAHGAETAALATEFVTEYWDGSAWQQNTEDACTAIAQTAIQFPDGTIDVIGNRTVAVGGGTSTGNFTDASSGAINFSSGNAGISFSAPGAGNTGSFNVDVDLTAYPWLRFDWDQDGSHDDSSLPQAEFTFGSYRGHDRVIFWQEIFSN